MSRCFECRGPKGEDEFICAACSKVRAERKTQREALDKIAGKRDWSENRALGGAKVHLSQKERKSIETLIGVPVEDAQDARRKMKERGFRFLDKGETLPSETPFQGWDTLLEGRKRDFSFNAAEAFAYHQARWRETHPLTED